jgi:hypothetical protein
MMVHWLKKESPVGLLESTGVGPAKTEPGSLLDWGPPPADLRDPATDSSPSPPSPPARHGPAPSSPAPAAAPPEPAPPATIEFRFAQAEAYERAHRHDVPGMHERWAEILALFPDPSHELFRRAAERAGALESRLKDAYRILRDEDPDALEGVGSARVKSMVVLVSKDLRSPDAALRSRAARLLGVLGRPEGVDGLARAMEREKDGETGATMAEAVERIGGAAAADALAEFRDDPRYGALEGLLRIAARSPVDRRIAVTRLAVFGRVRDEAIFDRAVRALEGMEYDGTIGLVTAGEAGGPRRGRHPVPVRRPAPRGDAVPHDGAPAGTHGPDLHREDVGPLDGLVAEEPPRLEREGPGTPGEAEEAAGPIVARYASRAPPPSTSTTRSIAVPSPWTSTAMNPGSGDAKRVSSPTPTGSTFDVLPAPLTRCSTPRSPRRTCRLCSWPAAYTSARSRSSSRATRSVSAR